MLRTPTGEINPIHNVMIRNIIPLRRGKTKRLKWDPLRSDKNIYIRNILFDINVYNTLLFIHHLIIYKKHIF